MDRCPFKIECATPIWIAKLKIVNKIENVAKSLEEGYPRDYLIGNSEFYGRKYLVPLPFNPPTSITCTHPKYKDKGACEREGFDWGSHGLVSAWFRTFGLGSCVNEDNEPYPNLMDRHTCEGAGHVWIEPVQEQNKWNIEKNCL